MQYLFTRQGQTEDKSAPGTYKPFTLQARFDEDRCVVVFERVTIHQTHRLEVYCRPRKGKETPMVRFSEVDARFGGKSKEIDLFTVVHLFMNATHEELAELADNPDYSGYSKSQEVQDEQ